MTPEPISPGQGVHGDQHRRHHDEDVRGVERGHHHEAHHEALLRRRAVGPDVAGDEVEAEREEEHEGGPQDEGGGEDAPAARLGQGEVRDREDGPHPTTSRNTSSSERRRAARR
jgi:hypothetical protein